MAEIARLLEVVRKLRAECPWDREQTVASTARHVIEEAYEVADAIASNDNADIAEELGDLLYQTFFVAVIAEDESRFNVAKVAREAADKFVRRHPHIYGDVKADTAEQVLSNWDKIKSEEKKDSRQRWRPREYGTRPARADARGEARRKSAPQRDGLARHWRGAQEGSRGTRRG